MRGCGLDSSTTVTLSIPIEFEGAPKGLAEGGVMTILRDVLRVRCLPRDIPEKFTLDVSQLALNESIVAGKFDLPAGVKLAEDSHDTIVTCAIPRVKVEEVPAEAAVPAEGEAVPGAEGEAAAGAEGAAAAGAPGAAKGAAPAGKGAAPAAKGAAPAAAEKPAKEGKGERKK